MCSPILLPHAPPCSPTGVPVYAQLRMGKCKVIAINFQSFKKHWDNFENFEISDKYYLLLYIASMNNKDLIFDKKWAHALLKIQSPIDP